MSMKTWKEEFYPIKADKCKKKDALKHSLQKWIGLRKSNMIKHELNYYISKKTELAQYCILCDENDSCFCVDDSSCALCFSMLASPVLNVRCR